jgi:hypothetical protein
VLYGNDTIDCNEDGSLSSAPTCTATCSAPSIENGVVSPSNGTIEAGQSFNASCNEGYVLYGNDTIDCNEDGSLSSAPTCTVTCSAPTIENGIVSPGTIEAGQSFNASCDDIYVMYGDDTIECYEDGSLSDAPTCTATCPAPTLDNGSLSPADVTIEAGQSFDASCDDDYVMYGNATIECYDDGTLDPTPTCIATCSPPVIDSASVTPSSAIEAGQSFNASCDDTYVMYGDDTIDCNDDGSLSDAPTCIATCTPPTIEDGSTEDYAIEAGQSFNAACSDGYVMYGDNTVECYEDGSLSDAPVCIATCSAPTMENGSTEDDTIEAGQSFNASCIDGYELYGDNTIECLDYETLSTVPNCIEEVLWMTEENVYAVTGYRKSLICKLSSGIERDITWNFGDETLTANQRSTAILNETTGITAMVTESSLTFEMPNTNFTGVYTCSARDEELESSANVYVVDPIVETIREEVWEEYSITLNCTIPQEADISFTLNEEDLVDGFNETSTTTDDDGVVWVYYELVIDVANYDQNRNKYLPMKRTTNSKAQQL